MPSHADERQHVWAADCLIQLEDAIRAAAEAGCSLSKRLLGPEGLLVKDRYLSAVVVDLGDESPETLAGEEGGERLLQPTSTAKASTGSSPGRLAPGPGRRSALSQPSRWSAEPGDRPWARPFQAPSTGYHPVVSFSSEGNYASTTTEPPMFNIEAFPVPADDFALNFTPAPAAKPGVSGSPETASARAAAAKRAEAERKRKERAKRKAGGIPDPRAVDAAIISAVAAACARRGHIRTIAQTKKLAGLTISLQDIVVGTMQELVEGKGIEQQKAKRAVIVRLGLGR